MKNSEVISIRGSGECRFSSELIPESTTCLENVIISTSNNNITISWNEVGNADSYSIYSSSDPNEPIETWLLEQSGIQDTSWTDISSGPKFYFVKTIINSF